MKTYRVTLKNVFYQDYDVNADDRLDAYLIVKRDKDNYYAGESTEPDLDELHDVVELEEDNDIPF